MYEQRPGTFNIGASEVDVIMEEWLETPRGKVYTAIASTPHGDFQARSATIAKDVDVSRWNTSLEIRYEIARFANGLSPLGQITVQRMEPLSP